MEGKPFRPMLSYGRSNRLGRGITIRLPVALPSFTPSNTDPISMLWGACPIYPKGAFDQGKGEWKAGAAAAHQGQCGAQKHTERGPRGQQKAPLGPNRDGIVGVVEGGGGPGQGHRPGRKKAGGDQILIPPRLERAQNVEGVSPKFLGERRRGRGQINLNRGTMVATHNDQGHRGQPGA